MREKILFPIFFLGGDVPPLLPRLLRLCSECIISVSAELLTLATDENLAADLARKLRVADWNVRDPQNRGSSWCTR